MADNDSGNSGQQSQQQQPNFDVLARLGAWLDKQEQAQQGPQDHPRRRSTDRPPVDPVVTETRDLLKDMREFFKVEDTATTDKGGGNAGGNSSQQSGGGGGADAGGPGAPSSPSRRERIARGFYGKRSS